MQESLVWGCKFLKPPITVSLSELEAVSLTPGHGLTPLDIGSEWEMTPFDNLEITAWDHLRNCSSDDEFLKRCTPDELVNMSNETLVMLTKHLYTGGGKIRTTPKILNTRKRYRNKLSAKRSKQKAKLVIGSLREFHAAICAEFKENPALLDMFDPATVALYYATLH